jgi:hypothetical protein
MIPERTRCEWTACGNDRRCGFQHLRSPGELFLPLRVARQPILHKTGPQGWRVIWRLKRVGRLGYVSEEARTPAMSGPAEIDDYAARVEAAMGKQALPSDHVAEWDKASHAA